jgi:carbon storage regulator
MLVLSRKKNESVVINSDVVITVIEVRGDKVRLGIVAPKDVPVHREEVYEAIHGKKPDCGTLPPPAATPAG